MIHFTYIKKFNTIIKDSNLNTGINPISEIIYGKNLTRTLLYFDHNEIKRLIDEGKMPDSSKMTHRLKIKNAGSIDFSELHSCYTSSIDDIPKKRASSFSLIFFLIPKSWDAGKGFDYSRNFFNEDFYDSAHKDKSRFLSTDGCNWYQARNDEKWDEDGVYSYNTLKDEYDKFKIDGHSDIIFAEQRFDVGAEDIDIDITEIVNKFVSGALENNGIGICFIPFFEHISEAKNSDSAKIENYVGLLTNKTNTFYEPYVETTYCDYISDDRANFILNKKNRIYLYSNIGGKPTDLDELPICVVKNDYDEIVFDNLEVKRQFKGVYYVELSLSSKDTEVERMYYDTWSNIKYDGEELDDVELDFTTKSAHNWFNIDNTIHDEPDYTPMVSGINDNESIYRNGEVRKIKVMAKPNFTQNVVALVDEMYYRIYVHDGEREVTVIPFEKVHQSFNENFFYLNCDMLIPQRYFIDIRFKYNGEVKTFKDVTHFTIISSLDNKYF